MWPSNSWLDEGARTPRLQGRGIPGTSGGGPDSSLLPLSPLGSPLHCSHALPSPPSPPAWSHLHLAGPLSQSQTHVISLRSSLQTPRWPASGRPQAGLRCLAGTRGAVSPPGICTPALRPDPASPAPPCQLPPDPGPVSLFARPDSTLLADRQIQQ